MSEVVQDMLLDQAKDLYMKDIGIQHMRHFLNSKELYTKNS